MVINNNLMKFEKVKKILSEHYSDELVNTFCVFHSCFVEVFKKIVEEYGGHTHFAVSDDCLDGSEKGNILVSVMCFKGTKVESRMYSVFLFSQLKNPSKELWSSVPAQIYDTLEHDFNYFCKLS